MDSQPQREMTYGEKAVGLTFNPSGDNTVNDIKTAYAGIIDTLNSKIIDLTAETNATNGEIIRLHKVAITEAQTAQMWAVKAVTYKF